MLRSTNEQTQGMKWYSVGSDRQLTINFHVPHKSHYIKTETHFTNARWWCCPDISFSYYQQQNRNNAIGVQQQQLLVN